MTETGYQNYSMIQGAHGNIVGGGTMLQAGKSWVRFPMRSMDFSIDLIKVSRQRLQLLHLLKRKMFLSISTKNYIKKYQIIYKKSYLLFGKEKMTESSQGLKTILRHYGK
jgi:hypothetical protein